MIKISTYYKNMSKTPWCSSLRILIPLYFTYILFVLSVLLVFIPNEKKQMMDQKKNMIQKLTESVLSLLSEYDQRIQEGELSPKEARLRAIKRIGNLRYGSEGKHYFWILDQHLQVIMHPYITELEGKNLTEIKNISGDYFSVDTINTLKNQEKGHLNYMWQWNNTPQKAIPKISFFKKFSPWHWVIGTGVYVEDIQRELKGVIRNFINIFSSLLIIVILLSIYISRQTVQIEKKKRVAEKARRLEELRLKKLLELSQMSDATMDELIAFSLKETVQLTQSTMGYLGFLNEEETELTIHSHPSKIIKQFRMSESKKNHHIDDTVLWTEAVRQRKAVVINDYAHYHAIDKKGYPPGHVKITRIMSIPVFEGQKMVALAGVGNKLHDYEESDVRQLQLMMGGMWKIIQKKTAEDTLRKSEERYRLLADNATDIIWIVQLSNLTFSYISPSVEQIMGYAPHEYIGRELGRQMKDEAIAQTIEIISEELELETHEPIDPSRYRTLEFQLPRKDGSKIWTEITARFLRDETGKPDRILGIARDISLRKKLEEKLRQSHKMEALGTLSGGIAHDFNNILSSILGYTELARIENITDEKIKKYLDRILAAGIRARDLVNHILIFSRRADVKKNLIQVAPLIRESLTFLRASIPKNIHIQHYLEDPDGTVMADATQMHQILMNLFTNAAHAMKEKGGTLDVQLKSIDIQKGEMSRVNELTPGPYLQLIVADTGCGISPKLMEKIFEPFFTTKECGEGTGMGLSIAYGIIKEMGGTISVYSEANMGTTFQVLLPAHHKKPQAREAPADPSLSPQKGRILLVDDDVSIVDWSRQLLLNLGYQVDSMTESPAALIKFKQRPQDYDLVLTDMAMPRINGLELSKQISKHRPDIPILICTGFSEGLTSERVKNHGISDIIMKPIIADELTQAVHRALKHS